MRPVVNPTSWAWSATRASNVTPKKVGTLPVEDRDEEKHTNEINIAIPLLEAIDIQGKTITADALLTQRELARYLVERQSAHYHFTVKANQKICLKTSISILTPSLENPITPRWRPPNMAASKPETSGLPPNSMSTWISLMWGRSSKYNGSQSTKKAASKAERWHGITSKTTLQANAAQVLQDNRGHWSIENSCHYIIDWNYDEDRSRIRTGHGSENMTRLRRFAVGLIKSKGVHNVAQKMRQLNWNIRVVFDYLKMTRNSCPVLATWRVEQIYRDCCHG
jgi:predicted transposase YbfD/YdcC